jgi:hypothetical protein
VNWGILTVPGQRDGVDGGHLWILFEDSESNDINGELVALDRLWCLETLKIPSNFVAVADLRLTLKFSRRRSTDPRCRDIYI